MNIDDLFQQFERDELEDKIEHTKFATPIEYARSRGIAPQKVYYHLRTGALTWHVCDCGRRVVLVEEVDAKLFPGRKDNGLEQQLEDEDAGEDEDELA